MKGNFIRVIRVTLLLFLLIPSLAGQGLFAQSNAPKLNDQFAQIYNRAYANRTNKSCLKTADSLYHKAEAAKDTYAQCLALSIPVTYYYNGSDAKAMLNAVNKLKEFCEKYNYESYYYYGCINYINFLLNTNHQYSALDYANNMKNDAEHKGTKYGIFVSKRALANIHYVREEYDEAKQDYIDAMDYAQKEGIHVSSFGTTYYRLASCCNEMLDHEAALKYAQMGASNEKASLNVRLRSSLEACIALFYLGKKDDFLKIYNKIEKNFYTISGKGSERLAIVKVMRALYDGDYNKAIATANGMSDLLERGKTMTMIHRYRKDFKSALASYTRWNIQRDSLNNELLQQDLNDQEILIGNHLLKEETQRIELMNAQLQLTNSNLELSKAKNSADAARISAENNRLGIKNKRLEAQNIKAQMEKQAMEQQEKDAATRNYRARMLTLFVAVSILLLLAAFYLFVRMKISKKLHISNDKLRQQNEDLNEARERAEQADRMKTMFIQNMSHEIRTPLNAIVGFSQILAECGDDISDEEKEDFSNRIEQSSDLVLNIINDILDLSTIESGHYKMVIKETKVNEMCRTALYNVKNRIPAGVELKFTTDVDDNYTIETDSKRVLQVIINFLTNAAKNTTEGFIHLHCSTTENKGYLSFSVADTGIGIAPEKMDVIFERFNKLDDMKQGAGLGLSICSIITERLNGLIYIDKTHLKGARFVFAVPLKKANITPPPKNKTSDTFSSN